MAEGESKFRHVSGPARTAQRILLVSLPAIGGLYLLEVHLLAGLVILRQQYLALLLSLTLGAVFLSVPAGRLSDQHLLPWYDGVLSFLGVIVGLYLVVFYPELIYSMGELKPERIALAFLAIILVLEATRRLLGGVMVAIVLAFLLYALYGDLIPGPVRSKGISLQRLLTHLYIGNDALLGIPIDVIGTVVLAFVLFGQALLTTGGARFLTDFCMATLGKVRGGPAKMAVVASGLFGTMSGSAVANVATTGVVTIPLMKNIGYRPHVAGAIEAAASNGGQLMPPIMGAAAFVMAEFLAVPYREVALAAAVPALLYYTILFIQIDLEAAKSGMKGLPAEKLPPLKPLLASSYVVAVPLLLVIYALFFMNLDPSKAGVFGAVVTLVLALFRAEGRAALRRFAVVLEDTGGVLIEVLVTGAVAGIVVGAIMISGLGFLLSLAVTRIAGEQLFPVLFLAAIVSIILGMGMGTVAVYVLVATLVGPALAQLGVLPMAAHLFLFYFGMMSLVTPPVCVASYTAAAIAGSHPMRTGFEAVRLGAVAYIVPFLFVYSPTLLLIGDFVHVLLAVVTAVAGTALMAVGLSGYLFRGVGWVWRSFLFAAGIALLVPPISPIPFSEAMNVVGGAVGLFFVAREWLRSRHQVDAPRVVAADPSEKS
ncbi:MAG: TRAP transporter fused permease subunit [Deltaproteobacteria bacterium]|nr:TRAP transporter fused permease subunit [Deltaproteobacteria bacterium]